MIAELEPTIGGPRVPMRERVALVDYETFYSVQYSVSDLSYWHYTHHPEFDAYLVSIVTSDGFEWVGHPKDAPWERIKDYIWVSHNRPFDWMVHLRLQELGVVPGWMPVYWGNSMNLCAYIRAPRALAKAVKVLYNVSHSKTTRDKKMKGKHWHEFDAALQAEVKEYALRDGRYALQIWMDHIHMWPTKELKISDLIDNRGLRGVHIDRDGCDADMKVLRRVIFEAEQKIPWRETGKILSPADLAQACRNAGIEPPPSLDMKDEECAAWEDKYGDDFPWVGAMRDWRRMNSLLQKYELIVSRIKDDGRAEFTIRYLGTHTGRTAAGEDKEASKRRTFNMLNLPRSPFYVRKDWTVAHAKKDLKRIEDHIKKHKALPDDIAFAIDLRRKIVPGPGKKFVICDMAQIEARVTNWLGRDLKTLRLIREGLSVYDVHAITLMGWVPPNPPVLDEEGKPKGLKKLDAGKYALAKARELALGFQAGHIRFIEMAPTYISDEECAEIFGKPITPEQEQKYLDYLARTRQAKLLKEYPTLPRDKQVARVNSQIQVEDFRSKKKWLPELWARLGVEFARSVGGKHEIVLPSGRLLQYFDVIRESEGRSAQYKARVERGGPHKYFYGGKLLENTVQATARDIFVEGQLKLDAEGIDVVLDIYDENLTEVPLDFPANRVAEIMTQNPGWAKSLPLGAEVEVSMFYKK